MLNENKFPTL